MEPRAATFGNKALTHQGLKKIYFSIPKSFKSSNMLKIFIYLYFTPVLIFSLFNSVHVFDEKYLNIFN